MSLMSSMHMGTPTRPPSAPKSAAIFWLLSGLITGSALMASRQLVSPWANVSVVASAVLMAMAGWVTWRTLRPSAGRQLASQAPDAHLHAWQAWLHGCQDAVMVLEQRHDPMGRVMGHVVTQANARAQDIFMPDGPPLVNQLLLDVLPAGLHPSFYERLQMAWEGREPQVDEHVLHPTPDHPRSAEARWLSHQMIPVPQGVMLVSRDTSEMHRSIQALHEQETFYRSLVDSLPMAVFARSTRAHNEGCYVVWNREAAKDMQISADMVLGQRTADILPAEMVEQSIALDRAVVSDPRVHEFHNLAYRMPQGERISDLIKAPVYGADGQLDHVLTIVRDVTEQRRAAEQLRLASRVIDETGDAVMVTDALDRVIMVNPTFLRMSGLRPHEVMGHDAELLGLAPLRESHLVGIQNTLDGGPRWSGESPMLGPDGRLLETWLGVSILRNGNQQITQHIRVFSDISMLKAQQRELIEQARRDSLTGLPNRREFSDRLRQAMARSRRQPQSLAVMYVDLDGFKAINDRLGHAAGDRLLIEVARRLERCVRTTDCVCRLSGDEFTIILEGAGHPEEVSVIADRIIESLAEPCQLDTDIVHTRASLGAALFRQDEDQESLCQRADTAMYAAKHAGKGRFVFTLAEHVPPVSQPCSGTH